MVRARLAGVVFLLAVWLLAPSGAKFSPVSPASAEVRFGNNVYVGGHNFSNQRFNRRNRAVINLHEGRPRNPGCVWRADGRGGRVKICHLQRR